MYFTRLEFLLFTAVEHILLLVIANIWFGSFSRWDHLTHFLVSHCRAVVSWSKLQADSPLPISLRSSRYRVLAIFVLSWADVLWLTVFRDDRLFVAYSYITWQAALSIFAVFHPKLEIFLLFIAIVAMWWLTYIIVFVFSFLPHFFTFAISKFRNLCLFFKEVLNCSFYFCEKLSDPRSMINIYLPLLHYTISIV